MYANTAIAKPHLRNYLSSFDYEKAEFLSYQALGFTNKLNVSPQKSAEPTHCVITWVLHPRHTTQLSVRKEQDCLFWWQLTLLLTQLQYQHTPKPDTIF